MTDLTNAGYARMMGDRSKWIDGDIDWQPDADHPKAVEFVVTPTSVAGYPIVVRGCLNRWAEKLSFMVIHQTAGRVFAHDYGSDHHNRTCTRVGESHEHDWAEGIGASHAERLNFSHDITDPAQAWAEFCRAAGIEHRGHLNPAPPEPLELFP